MILQLKECSNEIQEIIKNRAKLENERTGYNMELEQEIKILDSCYYYHMSRELNYEDYTVKIRNQGDYDPEKSMSEQTYMYAYEITIRSKHKYMPEIIRLSDLTADLGRYNKLPSWETLKSFFESDDIKQLFARYKEVHEQLTTAIQADIGREINETL